ncbi:glycoside hydrolase family 97 protein [Ornithobacterium rhinotracheale]|uniref:glycoside hydrolase family 97 protein n=1 Tax=Ornithobacterium rhinotracheale TaxID=28251 RepID=UPI004035BEA9
MNKYFLMAITALLFFSCTHPKQEVASPDGTIKLFFTLDSVGAPQYRVQVAGKDFIQTSALGFETRDSLNLFNGFKVEKITQNSTQQTWTQPWGENKEIEDFNNEMVVELKNRQNINLTLYFKVFNDGLGFRYEYKIPEKDSVFITNELTEFNFAQDGTSWAIPANYETYELEYKKQNISDLESANTPVTFKFSPELYASIHEAALTNFADMTLIKNSKNKLGFKADLAPYADGITKVKLVSRFKTPWRSIQIGKKAVDLINSALILNLNEPNAIGDTEWIKPVKYVGVWWGMHLGINSWDMGPRHGATTENAFNYIDFAEKNNIQAVLFEGWNEGWENWGTSQAFNFTRPYADFDIQKIADYAKSKNIAIIGHHETGGNIKNYESQLDSAFIWYKNLGIDMVKTGYAGGITGGEKHHGQLMVNHYRKVVETAAKYKIMLDVHEPIKPTGIRRTFPNMMTREGVRGMEWNAWSQGNSPEHTEVLPFTRMLSGPLDYTPGIFDILYETANNSKDRKKWNDLDPGNTREHTTLAKQIANWVILYSPMQMAADLIEHYDHPAFQFFRDFDADCDWSKALQGEPGEFVAIVRKANNKYFLGASTNENARKIEISLDFLEKNRKYKATIYADGADANWQTNPLSYQIMEKEVSAKDRLTIEMAPGGGQAIVFVPL